MKRQYCVYMKSSILHLDMKGFHFLRAEMREDMRISFCFTLEKDKNASIETQTPWAIYAQGMRRIDPGLPYLNKCPLGPMCLVVNAHAVKKGTFPLLACVSFQTSRKPGGLGCALEWHHWDFEKTLI